MEANILRKLLSSGERIAGVRAAKEAELFSRSSADALGRAELMAPVKQAEAQALKRSVIKASGEKGWEDVRGFWRKRIESGGEKGLGDRPELFQDDDWFGTTFPAGESKTFTGNKEWMIEEREGRRLGRARTAVDKSIDTHMSPTADWDPHSRFLKIGKAFASGALKAAPVAAVAASTQTRMNKPSRRKTSN